MKRTAMQHTKLKMLVRALGLPQYAAVGILESIWHLTAKEAVAGNIGKLSNEAIAIWIDWDGDANKLVDALVKSGWLDEHAQHRLVVHDWLDHCDDGAKKAISRMRETDSDKPRRKSKPADKKRLPKPLPKPEPQPQEQKPPVADAPAASQRSPNLHEECKQLIHTDWRKHHPDDQLAPWDGSEAKQLRQFLDANPRLSAAGFERLLEHRARSEVNLSERPRKWIANLKDFTRGPLDKFHQLMETARNGVGKATGNSAAGRVERTQAGFAASFESFGLDGPEEDSYADGGAVPPAGIQPGHDGRIQPPVRADDGEARAGAGANGAAGAVRSAGPEVLSPSRRSK